MTVKERRILSDMRQRTLFDLTQDGLVIGRKLERIYPDFDTHTFVKDVRTEMEGQTIYNVKKAVGRVLRHHLPENYSDALAILMTYVDDENANLRLFVCASICTRGIWQKWIGRFIPDPQPMLVLLEALKDDTDACVREQVATDMRDIVKDYPDEGYATLERWSRDGRSETKKIIRGALKYQLKIGDKRALKLLGLGTPARLGNAQVTLLELKPEREVVPINDEFRFSFSLQSDADEPQTILTHYIISYKHPTSRVNAIESANESWSQNRRSVTINFFSRCHRSSSTTTERRVSAGTALNLR